jgi:arylesterase/paraoxonase
VPGDLHPHGLSLWHGPNGQRRLFVINHPDAGGHVVEIYDATADGLTHAESVRYPDLASPNDLVAVGPRQFYATNDRRYREPGLMATLEAYLQLPLSSVSYFDGSTGRIAVDGLVFANGINASADGRTVYVAAFLERAIHVYDRNPATGQLTQRDVIEIGSCPDNIEVDRAGMLWVAAHAKVFDLVVHSTDPTRLAPSQIFRVNPHTRAMREVYLDSGATLSAASTAAVAGDVMLLGAIFEPKVLVCDRPPA